MLRAVCNGSLSAASLLPISKRERLRCQQSKRCMTGPGLKYHGASSCGVRCWARDSTGIRNTPVRGWGRCAPRVNTVRQKSSGYETGMVSGYSSKPLLQSIIESCGAHAAT